MFLIAVTNAYFVFLSVYTYIYCAVCLNHNNREPYPVHYGCNNTGCDNTFCDRCVKDQREQIDKEKKEQKKKEQLEEDYDETENDLDLTSDDEYDNNNNNKPNNTVLLKSISHKPSKKRLSIRTRSRRKAKAKRKRKRQEIEKCVDDPDITFYDDASDTIASNDDDQLSINVGDINYHKQEPPKKKRKIEKKEIDDNNDDEDEKDKQFPLEDIREDVIHRNLSTDSEYDESDDDIDDGDHESLATFTTFTKQYDGLILENKSLKIKCKKKTKECEKIQRSLKMQNEKMLNLQKDYDKKMQSIKINHEQELNRLKKQNKEKQLLLQKKSNEELNLKNNEILQLKSKLNNPKWLCEKLGLIIQHTF